MFPVSRALVVGALVGLACASPPPPFSEPDREAEYHVGPADTLSVSVETTPRVDRQLLVRPDGRISMDLIGDVKVADRTIPEIHDEMRRRLGKFIVRPSVTVSLAASNSRVYLVFGEVERPGAYPLVGRVTAATALARAGGATFLGQVDSASLARRSAEGGFVHRVDFDAIIRRGDASTDYELEPGDVLYMPPNASGRIGNFLRLLFYPIHQILGIGARVYRPERLDW